MLNCLPVFPGCLHAMSKYCKQCCSYSISGSTQSTKCLKCSAKCCSLGMRIAALSQAFSNHMFTSLLLTLLGITLNPEEKPIKNKWCCIGYNMLQSEKKELSFLLHVSHRKLGRRGVRAISHLAEIFLEWMNFCHRWSRGVSAKCWI